MLGEFGYVLMVVTGLLSTTGAVNSGLYPSVGMTQHLASVGQFPPVLGRSVGRRQAPVGLLTMAGLTLVLVVAYNLNNIASLGSAVALLVFSVITAGHLRVRRETGARPGILVAAVLAMLGTFTVFVATTLVDEPASAVALVAILAFAVAMDLGWKRRRPARDPQDPGQARMASE